jgi:hypothetical protein
MTEYKDLRDYFAAHAMQGILAGRFMAGRSNTAFENISNLAYYMADSMMIQRASPEHPEDDE